MTIRNLVLRSLWFYRRPHLAVAAGAAIGAAVLTGALLTGDSVRASLKSLALARLGRVEIALNTPARFFRSELGPELAATLQADVAAVLSVRGTATAPETRLRANEVRVLGIDESFWALAPAAGKRPPMPGPGEAVLNRRLAGQLNLAEGDTVLLRVERPSPIPRDAAPAIRGDIASAIRVRVRGIVADSAMGRFTLEAVTTPPLNICVPREWLAGALGIPRRANLLLAAGPPGRPLAPGAADRALRRHWRATDAGIEARSLPDRRQIEVRSDRIFVEAAVADAVSRIAPDATAVFTYLVNEIGVGDRAVPYSMVAAIGPLIAGRDGPLVHLAPARSGQIALNAWLAGDLGASTGDILRLAYFMPGAGRRIEEHTNSLTVSAVIPLEGPAADPDLMPGFPGIESSESCRDWKSGFPVDLSRVRPKDEDYWRDHRGTPKAFIRLEDGRAMWASRFGDLTAIRISAPHGEADAFAARLAEALNPADLGFSFQPVREMALKAGAQSFDFGPLFLGFSLFLIVSAVLLTALLFAFHVEQRSDQAGLLLAVGIRPARVRTVFLIEGTAAAAVGGLVGGAVGALYTRLILYGLGTFWRGAAGGVELSLSGSVSSIVIGVFGGIAVAALAMWLTLRWRMREPIRALLTDSAPAADSAPAVRPGRGRALRWIAALCGAGALLIGVAGVRGSGGEAAAAFFLSGSLVLCGAIVMSRVLLARAAKPGAEPARTLGALARRYAGRRLGRNTATVALTACATFMIMAVGANRSDPSGDGASASGTGGFRLIGQSSLPFFGDLNSPATQHALGLDIRRMSGTDFVQFRVREGDDASCLNMNRAQSPRIIGLRPEDLNRRRAFTFIKALKEDVDAPWSILESSMPDGAIPAVADETTVTWGLHKSVGDTIVLRDEAGRDAVLRIVGMIGNSVLQGSLLISERHFERLFPSESGCRLWLARVPDASVDVLSADLSRALEDYGLEVTRARDRLEELSVVENTYLSIFQVLGALGLLLGSAGLGIVVGRHIMERRSELAMLRAVGFRRADVRRAVFLEHSGIFLTGVAAGTISAAVALAPVLIARSAEAPWASLAAMLLAVIGNGLLWILAGIRSSLRGSLLAALRNE